MPYTAQQLADGFNSIYDLRHRHDVLQDINSLKTHPQHGAVVWVCPDCAQIAEQERVIKEVACAPGLEPHRPGLNGGLLVVAPHSPINHEVQQSPSALYNIVGSVNLKRLPVVILGGHWPCGVGELCGMTHEQYFQAMAEGAQLVRRALPRSILTRDNSLVAVEVGVIFHVDWTRARGDDVFPLLNTYLQGRLATKKSQLTYRFSGTKWNALVASRKGEPVVGTSTQVFRIPAELLDSVADPVNTLA